MIRLLLISFLLSFNNAFSQNLISAIKSNDITLAKKLIKKGESVNQRDTNGATPLMWAVLKSDLKFCQHLVKKGADSKLKGVIYLDSTHAQYYGNLLGICVMNEKYDILEWLVKHEKIDINDREFNKEDNAETGWIPIQFAVYTGSEAGIDRLIKLGANVQYVSVNDSSNMLLDAINYKNTKLVKKILDIQGVNLNQKNINGFSALHYAVYLNLGEVVDLLLKKALNVNQQSDSLITPLHASISTYLPLITKVLIENGADTSLRNVSGETGGTIARTNGCKGLQNILKKNYESLINPPYDSIYINYSKYYYADNDDSVAKYSGLLYQQATTEFYENTGKYEQSLNFAGVGFYRSKKFSEAIVMFKKSLLHIKQYRSEDTGDRCTYLNNIISTYSHLNAPFDTLKIYFAELLHITKQFYGDTSIEYLKAWRLEIFYFSKESKTNLVVPEYKKFIELCEKNKKFNSEYFNVLNSLVVLYSGENDFENAVTYFDIILKYYKKDEMPAGFDFPHALKNISISLSSQNDTLSSKSYLSLYRSLLLKQNPLDLNDLFTYNFLKGAYFFKVHKNDSAFFCYKNCIKIGKTYSKIPTNDIACSYLKCVTVLINANRLEEADLYLDTSINRFNAIKDLAPNYFNDINNTQNTYFEFSEYKTALRLNDIILRMASNAHDTSNFLFAQKFRFYALYKDGQIELAKSKLPEVLTLDRKVNRNDYKKQISFLRDVAYFYSLIKDSSNTIKYYKQIQLFSRSSIDTDTVELEMNYKIALIRAENGNAETANHWFKNESKRIEQLGNYYYLEKSILDENVDILRKEGKITEAIKRCSFWVNIFKDKDQLKWATWTIKLADVYNISKDYKLADLFYKSVETSLLKNYNPNSPELVMIYAKLGVNYFQNNQFGMALPYFKKVIELEEKNGASSAVLKSYYNSLKIIYYGINDMTSAEFYSNKLVKISERDIKTDFKYFLKSRTDHIFIKQLVGKYDEAEDVANDLQIKMYRYKQFGPEDRIKVYSELGAFYDKIGNRSKALSSVDSASFLTNKYFGTSTEKVADAGIRKSLIYIGNGKSKEGLAQLRDQYTWLKNKVSDTAEYLNETLCYLGLVYMFRKEYDSAIVTLKIVQNNYMSKNILNSTLTTSLKYAAIVYGFKKDYNSALTLIRLAQNITLKQNGKLNNYWDLSVEIGRTQAELKQYDSALIVLNEILENRNTIGLSNKDILYEAQLEKAYVLKETGKYQESYSLLSDYLDAYKDKILDEILFLSASERETYLSSKSKSFRSINMKLIIKLDRAPQFGNLILDNEIFIKGLALETNTKLLQLANSTTDPELDNLLDQIKIGKSKLDNLYLQNDVNKNEVADLESEIAGWEKTLNKKLGSNFKGDYKKNYTLELKNKLKPKEVLIDFFSRDKMSDADLDIIFYYAIVLAKDFTYPKIVKITDNKALDKLFANTDNLNSAARLARIYDTRGAKRLNNQSVDFKSSYALIWQKIDSMIIGKKDVYITPSGYLNKLAFAAIKDTSSVYISDKYNIHVLSSSRQILKAENTVVPKKKVGFVLGGINYDLDSARSGSEAKLTTRSYTFDDDSTRSGFSYLEGTYTETQKIVSYLAGKKFTVNYLSGKQASEEQFKKMESSKPFFIHIATHGFYLPESKGNSTSLLVAAKSENPLLRSGLILAGGNKAWLGKPIANGKEDGILNSFEISNMDLRQTKFVVLSACETGLGDIKGSEGVFGLQRAFKLAGVEYIVNSLWQVPDEQTSELMQTLYFHWSKGVPFEEAFFRAQKALKAKYEPYYWAAFQLVK